MSGLVIGTGPSEPPAKPALLAAGKRAPSRRSFVIPRLGALLWSLGLALLVLYLLFYLARVADLIAYPYDVDQGEGYDINSGWLLAQGRPIYTDNAEYPYYSSNYPPVFSLLLVPIVSHYGPLLGTGRALSAIAALLTAALVGLIVWEQTNNGPAGSTAALLYLGSNYVYHVTPLARVNALAALFALIGVYCCLRRAKRALSRGSVDGWLLGAVIAFLLAMFTKPTTIDAVAAGLLFLLARDLRAGLAAGAVVGALGLALLIGLDAAHDGQFWVNVVAGNVNPFLPEQAMRYYLNFLGLHGILVGLAGWQVSRTVRRGAWGPFELYWALALALAVSVGKWGAGESYFLAPIVASCVLAGTLLGQAVRWSSRRPRTLALLGALVLVQALLLGHGPIEGLAPGLWDRGIQAASLARYRDRADLDAAAQLVDHLRELEGPVLSEDPGYSLVAGKEVVGNATHLRNLHQSGFWRADGLLADVEQRRFRWVVLDAELYPEPVLEAVGRAYYLYDFFDVNGTRQLLFAPGEE